MQIVYNSKTDVLYLRLDSKKQAVHNKRFTEDIVLDLGDGDKIVGIEILDASAQLELQNLLPVQYKLTPELA